MKLLQVKNLKVAFNTERGKLLAVDDVSFDLTKGQTLAVVGESGCGKTVTALSVLRLISSPGEITSGQILFQGIDLLQLKTKEIEKIRGKKISMIFQEPMSSLNPLLTIGEQVIETLRFHFPDLSKSEAQKKTVSLFQQVGIPTPEKRMNSYPHQLSGGQRQRVMIAIAISCQPDLLIADEPTTALDVTIQAQILSLLKELQLKNKMGLMLITHDLGLVAENCHDVIVMYAGKIAEMGTTDEIFYQTHHPYTQGLLGSIPYFQKRQQDFKTIQGSIPDLLHLPKGCRFQNRCDKSAEQCQHQEPPLTMTRENRGYACHFPGNEVKR